MRAPVPLQRRLIMCVPSGAEHMLPAYPQLPAIAATVSNLAQRSEITVFTVDVIHFISLIYGSIELKQM